MKFTIKLLIFQNNQFSNAYKLIISQEKTMFLQYFKNYSWYLNYNISLQFKYNHQEEFYSLLDSNNDSQNTVRFVFYELVYQFFTIFLNNNSQRLLVRDNCGKINVNIVFLTHPVCRIDPFMFA